MLSQLYSLSNKYHEYFYGNNNKLTTQIKKKIHICTFSLYTILYIFWNVSILAETRSIN